MANTVRPPTALDDTGTVHAFVLLGWIPPAVAAIAGGVIVGIATGSVLTLVGVVLGGTVAGYVMSLALLFTVGYIFAGHVGERVANGLLVSIVAVSVVTALAVAVSASGVEFDPVLVDSVAQGMDISLGLAMIVLLVVGLVALAIKAVRRVARRMGRRDGD